MENFSWFALLTYDSTVAIVLLLLPYSLHGFMVLTFKTLRVAVEGLKHVKSF